MSIETLKETLPDYAKDIRLNLSAVLKEDPSHGLSLNKVLGIALASAHATRNQALVNAVAGEAAAVLTAEETHAAKAAATIMAMNNVYFRATHMLKDEEILQMPAGLRMNVIGNPGIDKMTFELYELAVSAINGCTGCIEAHAHALQQHDVSKHGIQHTFKIAAVINAAAQALSIQ